MMMRSSVGLVTMLAVILPTGAGLAEIEMPDRNGVKQPVPDRVLAREGRPWEVWVAYEGYRPRQKWLESSNPEGFTAFEFMQRVSVLYRHQGESGNYLLLGESDTTNPVRVRRVLGWVREDYTVGSQESLEVKSTKIRRKAMLITRVENEGTFTEEVPLMDSPRQAGASVRHNFKLFNIFFIFGETKQRLYGSSQQDYVLLGNRQYFDLTRVNADAAEEGAPGNVVLGWVPRKRIAPWDTREAIEWDRRSTMAGADSRRTAPGQVFGSVQVAKAFADKSDQARAGSLFSERFDEFGRSVPFKPHHMRYPILAWEPDELLLPGGSQLPRKYRSNELVKIGCIGAYGGLSSAEVDDLKRQLGYLNDMVSTTEILFVIDDTGSMFEYFPDVADLVRAITSNAQQIVPNVRVAVAFYNDTDNKPSGWNPVLLDERSFPLKTAERNGRGIAAFVGNHKAVSGGDEPELVFRGIREAVAAADFSPYARKLVIAIGDNQDKQDNPRDYKDEAAIVKRLYTSGIAPIEFFCVQVGSATTDRFTRAFRDQMQAIVKLLNEEGKRDQTLKRTLGKYVNAGNDEFQAVLWRRYAELEAQAKSINAKMEKIRAGEFQTDIGPEYNAILERAGIDLSKLKKQEGVQLFREGYVWRYSSADTTVPQVRMKLLLDAATIEDMIKYMHDLANEVRNIFRQGNKVTVGEALTKLVQDAIGEEKRPDPDLSFEEQVLKRLGLRAHSPFLKKPIGAKFSERLTQEEAIEIGHRLDILRDILAGKRRTWRKLPGPKYEAVGEAADEERHFKLPGSQAKWYWIDVEEELP